MSAWSMSMRSLAPSATKPDSAAIRPVRLCGTPSGPISPRTLADSGKFVSRLLSSTRAASRRSLAETCRPSISMLWAPSRVGLIAAVNPQGRPALSEPRVTTTPPPRGRSRLSVMSRNDQRLPVRVSSTVRLPSLSPSSRNSWPSRPDSPMPSIHDNSAAKMSLVCRAGAAGAGVATPPVGDVAASAPLTAAATGAAAVAIGCLLAPAKTVTSPSCSMRTAISAPTRLRLSARMWPLSRLMPETRTSALGALATTVPSGSRTTMSRMRTAAPPFSVRSICVPPTSTRCSLPKFSSMAEASHGVATSS